MVKLLKLQQNREANCGEEKHAATRNFTQSQLLSLRLHGQRKSELNFVHILFHTHFVYSIPATKNLSSAQLILWLCRGKVFLGVFRRGKIPRFYRWKIKSFSNKRTASLM